MTPLIGPVGIDLHIDVRHLDYWWGVYGLTAKTSWEDVLLYREPGEGCERLGAFCICTPRNLESGLEEPADGPEEGSYQALVRRFLRERTLQHRYYSPEDEATFEAARGREGVKRPFMEIWHPADGVDLDVILECARSYCKEAFGLEVKAIHYKAPLSAEDALRLYRECPGVREVRFSDELVQQLCREWGKPREEVLEVLRKSAGKSG